jgi:UDP-glucose 4-epimerase
MAVLVTGGAGYIGSHSHHVLCDAGIDVVVIDNLSSGYERLLHPNAKFVFGDIGDSELLKKVISKYRVTGIIHFAASLDVEESVRMPSQYYQNNYRKAVDLIETSFAEGVRNFIFSSTAAVYGNGVGKPFKVGDLPNPISPYGRSKLMVEWFLEDFGRINEDFRYKILRYFNVAGAHPNGKIGQIKPDASHLIKIACQVATEKRDALQIYGNDYETPDGTGVRDYIHVMDVAEIHKCALESLEADGESGIYNCGYGNGYSVLEVITEVSKVSNREVKFSITDRRPGDPASVIADPGQLSKDLNWTPAHSSLSAICRSAYEWEKQL